MLAELKNLSLPRIDIEGMVALLVFAEGMQAKYDALEMETPAWLDEKIKVLGREIRDRNHDALLAKIRSAKSRIETMKPLDEKRKDAQKELKRLEAQLAGQ